MENAPESESTFADFYKIAGLSSVYLASQLDQGVQESNIRCPSSVQQRDCGFWGLQIRSDP